MVARINVHVLVVSSFLAPLQISIICATKKLVLKPISHQSSAIVQKPPVTYVMSLRNSHLKRSRSYDSLTNSLLFSVRDLITSQSNNVTKEAKDLAPQAISENSDTYTVSSPIQASEEPCKQHFAYTTTNKESITPSHSSRGSLSSMAFSYNLGSPIKRRRSHDSENLLRPLFKTKIQNDGKKRESTTEKAREMAPPVVDGFIELEFPSIPQSSASDLRDSDCSELSSVNFDDQELYEILIDKEVEELSDRRSKLLIETVLAQDEKRVQDLLESGASPYCTLSETGQPIFHYALERGNIEIAAHLFNAARTIEMQYSDDEIIDSFAEVPRQLTAREEQYATLAQEKLDNQLLNAILTSDAPLVERSIKEGANPKGASAGKTFFDIARERCSLKCAEILLRS